MLSEPLYAGYIICDNCGKVITADGNYYRCTTYLYSGGPKSGCYRNRVSASTIDRYVEDWLESTGQVLEWTTDTTPVTSLYKIRLVNDRHRALRKVVENYLSVKLSQVFPFEEHDGARRFEIPGQEIVETAEGTDIVPITHRFSLPGYIGDPGVLCDLLSAVESSENNIGSSQRTALESRKSHILRIFPEALNKSLRDSLVQELNTIDSQLEMAGVTDYAKQHRNLLIALHEVYGDIKVARTVTVPQARRNVLMGVIREIRCKFVQKTMIASSRSCLESVTVIPNTGPIQGDVRTTGAGGGVNFPTVIIEIFTSYPHFINNISTEVIHISTIIIHILYRIIRSLLYLSLTFDHIHNLWITYLIPFFKKRLRPTFNYYFIHSPSYHKIKKAGKRFCLPAMIVVILSVF